MSKVIKFLKTLPENSGQLVELETSQGAMQFYFMWFINDEQIDLKPVGSIQLLTVHKRDWHKIKLIF